jgi:hypothetical protein
VVFLFWGLVTVSSSQSRVVGKRRCTLAWEKADSGHYVNMKTTHVCVCVWGGGGGLNLWEEIDTMKGCS